MSSEYWYVYFCVPSEGPHLLWIVAPRRKTVDAPGFTMSTVGSAPPQAICDWEALHGYRLGETVRSDVERTFVLGTLWLGYITVICNWLFIAVVANGNLLKQSLEMSHWIIKALRSKWKGFSSLWTRKRSALQLVQLIFAIMGSLKGFINMLSTLQDNLPIPKPWGFVHWGAWMCITFPNNFPLRLWDVFFMI